MAPRCEACPDCRNSLTFEEFHTGFNNTGYAYCDRDSIIAVWDTFDRTYIALVGDQHPWTLAKQDKRRVETALRGCPCGGHFGMDNAPRCPHCSAALPDLLPDKIYFADFGKRLDPPIWKQPTV